MMKPTPPSVFPTFTPEKENMGGGGKKLLTGGKKLVTHETKKIHQISSHKGFVDF